MKRLVLFLIILILAVIPVLSQDSNQGLHRSPKEIVDQVWKLATEGELLTEGGWHRMSGFYSKETPWPGNKIIYVVSNSWGLDHESIKGNDAEVIMGFIDLGKIDSEVRYRPPEDRGAIKEGRLYHLELAPSHWHMYGPDGKTVIKEMTGPAGWQIVDAQGPPWTTVNTAIRYVLEMRNKGTDPVLRKNADATLAKLLELH